MRRWKAILAACLLCAAAACGGSRNNMVVQDTVKNTLRVVPEVQPRYLVTPIVEEKTSTAEDGTVLAECSYQLLTMTVENLSELSEEGAERAEQVARNFNERMDKRMEDALAYGRELEQMAEKAWEEGFLFLAYGDKTTAEAVLQGQIYSIRVENSSYSGGAHPNSYTDGELFDLEMGQYIDPAQVADDPVAFQLGGTELLLAKADEQDAEIRSGYYPEYADVISHWYDGTVLFDAEGMTVVYSPYELGPYAMGTVELKASYEELAQLLGPGGLERLGLAEEEAQDPGGT